MFRSEPGAARAAVLAEGACTPTEERKPYYEVAGAYTGTRGAKTRGAALRR